MWKCEKQKKNSNSLKSRCSCQSGRMVCRTDNKDPVISFSLIAIHLENTKCQNMTDFTSIFPHRHRLVKFLHDIHTCSSRLRFEGCVAWRFGNRDHHERRFSGCLLLDLADRRFDNLLSFSDFTAAPDKRVIQLRTELYSFLTRCVGPRCTGSFVRATIPGGSHDVGLGGSAWT